MIRFLKFGLASFVVGIFMGYYGANFYEDSQGKKFVLSMKSQIPETAPTATITPTFSEPEASPTPLPTNTPTLSEPEVSPIQRPSSSPTLTPTPASTVQSYSPEQIHGFIGSFAGQYNVDPNVLRHIAVCESGFNTNAVNGPYAGLYQFSASAWKNYRQEIGEDLNEAMRFNAEEAVQTAAYILATNRAYIWPNCVP